MSEKIRLTLKQPKGTTKSMAVLLRIVRQLKPGKTVTMLQGCRRETQDDRDRRELSYRRTAGERLNIQPAR